MPLVQFQVVGMQSKVLLSHVYPVSTRIWEEVNTTSGHKPQGRDSEASLLICSPDTPSMMWLCARISPGWRGKVQHLSNERVFLLLLYFEE